MSAKFQTCEGRINHTNVSWETSAKKAVLQEKMCDNH